MYFVAFFILSVAFWPWITDRVSHRYLVIVMLSRPPPSSARARVLYYCSNSEIRCSYNLLSMAILPKRM